MTVQDLIDQLEARGIPADCLHRVSLYVALPNVPDRVERSLYHLRLECVDGDGDCILSSKGPPCMSSE